MSGVVGRRCGEEFGDPGDEAGGVRDHGRGVRVGDDAGGVGPVIGEFLERVAPTQDAAQLAVGGWKVPRQAGELGVNARMGFRDLASPGDDEASAAWNAAKSADRAATLGRGIVATRRASSRPSLARARWAATSGVTDRFPRGAPRP